MFVCEAVSRGVYYGIYREHGIYYTRYNDQGLFKLYSQLLPVPFQSFHCSGRRHF